MSRNVCFRAVSALGVLLLISAAGMNRLNAQATATISGTVTDASGAAIPDAAIQAKNSGTGLTQTATTDAGGRYTIPQLGIGQYDIQASKAGFSTVDRKGVTLTVGAQPIVDFQLAVGQQQQTVTVEGAVAQVETQTTAVGALVETKQVQDLPLNGRNYTQLLVLAPGVTQIPPGAPGAGSTFYGNGQKYTIAGSRPSGQPYLLDDQDMVNFWNNGPGAGGLGTALGVEAIAEFQTLTNTYSPQFGGNGAVINASSKSGTNAFHGSAYEFLRNNKLEARNFFDNTVLPGHTSAEPPTFRQNQFGGSIGGPIKKDKAFFFFNYEGLKKTQVVDNIVTVPDACTHNAVVGSTPGIATTFTCGVGAAGPLTATTSTNAAAAQAVQNIMALYPLPNYLAEAGNGTGRAVVEDPNIGRENYLLGRVDYTLTEKDSLFARYMLDFANRDFVTNIPYWPEYDRTRDHFASVEWRRIISATFVNVAHVGFSRTYEDAYVYGSPTVANGVAAKGSVNTPAAGILGGAAVTSGYLSPGVHPLQFFNQSNPAALNYAVTTAGIGIPREDGSISAGSGITTISASSTLPFYLVPNKFQYGDDIIWTHGAHNITAGISIKRVQDNTWAPFVVAPQWSFANLGGFVSGTPSSLNGQVSDNQAPFADSVKDFRYWIYEPYINDQWKVSSRLTVNLGLRYSPESLIHETRHVEEDLINAPYGNWVPVTQSTASNPSWKNWDPRVGIAFDPFSDHKTSIRASFGEFHSVLYSRDLNFWLEPPFLTDLQTPTSVNLNGTPAPVSATFPNPFSNLPVNAATLTSIPANGSLSCTNCNFYGVHSTPHQIQFNFNIQREVMANTVASIGYVHTHGIDLWAQRDTNTPIGFTGPSGLPTYGTYDAASNSILPTARPNPAYGYLQMGDTLADSHYDALQASVNRRFSKGLQFQFSYTFSKSIDDSSGTYGLDGGGAVYNPNNYGADRGLSNFSRTHNFRLSGIYNLPYTGHGVLGQVAGGWQTNFVYSYLSGAPFTVGTIANRVENSAGESAARPNSVAGCSLYTGVTPEQAATGTSSPWFNASCFTAAPVGTYGNAGRDTMIGPNIWDVDFALQKDWKVTKITEAFTVQFKAEAFNVFNHPSFGQPNGTVFNPALSAAVATNPLAGVSNNGSAGTITSTNSSPRQIQLALKIVF
jgi:hypothetical protein